MHANDPVTVILKKNRPSSAGPRRHQSPIVNKLDEHDENICPETSNLDISIRVTQARIARGFKTRKDLAKALNISVDVITCIESRKGKLDKQLLNKTCQFLRIKTT